MNSLLFDIFLMKTCKIWSKLVSLVLFSCTTPDEFFGINTEKKILNFCFDSRKYTLTSE